MGEQLLRRLGVDFHELLYRWRPMLKYSVKIIYRSHLEITPTSLTCPPFPKDAFVTCSRSFETLALIHPSI
jgi:hypothetical protein